MKKVCKPWDKGALRVDGTWLKNGEEPFFWMGDTAWLMFMRLTRDEMRTYLKNRAEKGINVIQAVAVMRIPGTNVMGQNPFSDCKALTPDLSSRYWENLDYAFDVAQELGIYIGLLPTWGGVVKKGSLCAEVARSYADFLAGRFGNRPNIIWINGGDCRGCDGFEFWQAMGYRLKELTPDRLVCYHTFGRTLASDYFYDSSWLDVDMFQSGHRRYDQVTITKAFDNNAQENFCYGEDNWRYVDRSHAKAHKRPVLDAEPSYENIPQGLHDPKEPLWTAQDVRRYAYWSVMEGACGFTYGHNAIMQFAYEGELGSYGCTEGWQDAMNHPGADSMKHFKELFTSLPFQSACPAPELLDCPVGEQYERICAVRGDGFAAFYTYTGRKICLKAGVVDGQADIIWFNPESGVRGYCGHYNAAQETLQIKPPVGKYDNSDWLLLIERA